MRGRFFGLLLLFQGAVAPATAITTVTADQPYYVVEEQIHLTIFGTLSDGIFFPGLSYADSSGSPAHGPGWAYVTPTPSEPSTLDLFANLPGDWVISWYGESPVEYRYLTVSVSGPVPEPTTGFLVAAGLIGIAAGTERRAVGRSHNPGRF